MDLPPQMPATPNAFQDRRTGLKIFGFLTLMLGGLFALFAAAMTFTLTMHPTAATAQAKAVLPMVLIEYGGLAVALVWLGIGSMMARRWARALLLIFSWSWLVMGVYVCVVLAVMLPRIMNDATHPNAVAKAEVNPAAAGTVDAANPLTPVPAPAMPAAATTAVSVIVSVVMFVMFIAMPGVWLLFYRSPHVKATCEAYDPVVRWTDGRPLPVTAMSLWLAVCTPMTLLGPAMYNGVLPAFGTFVTGPVGSILYVVLALNWGYCAWLLYRMQPRGWSWTVGTFVVVSISMFITYSRHEITEMYTLMGMSAGQIAQMQTMNFMQGHSAAWITLLSMLPFYGFLFYLRRFFIGPQEAPLGG